MIVVREQARDLFERRVAFDDQRRGIGELDARTLAENLAVIRQRILVHERALVDERNGTRIVENGDGVQRRILIKQAYDVVVARR